MTFTKALIPIVNTQPYEALRDSLKQTLSTNAVEEFLRRLERSKIRVRDWEKALASGALGAESQAQYNALNAAEKGMIRENYLASIEEVDMRLRKKFKNLYGYY